MIIILPTEQAQVKMSCTIKSPTRASRTKRVMSHNLWGEFILIIKLQTLPNRNPSFHLKKEKKTDVWVMLVANANIQSIASGFNSLQSLNKELWLIVQIDSDCTHNLETDI